MSIIFRRREPPGPCPICGAPNSSCTHYGSAPGARVAVAQLPARDGVAAGPALQAPAAAPAAAQAATSAGTFTTGTYRRNRQGRQARR